MRGSGSEGGTEGVGGVRVWTCADGQASRKLHTCRAYRRVSSPTDEASLVGLLCLAHLFRMARSVFPHASASASQPSQAAAPPRVYVANNVISRIGQACCYQLACATHRREPSAALPGLLLPAGLGNTPPRAERHVRCAAQLFTASAMDLGIPLTSWHLLSLLSACSTPLFLAKSAIPPRPV